MALGLSVASCGPQQGADSQGRCPAGPLGVGEPCRNQSATAGAGFFPGESSGADSSGLGEGVVGSTNCIDVRVGFERATPTVLLLIDQSSSMERAFDDSDRWTIVKDALLNSEDGIIPSFEQRVRFGLMLFSSARDSRVDQCPLLTMAPAAGGEIQFELGSYPSIFDAFAPADVVSETPTGESLLAAADALEAVVAPGPKEIILATDGEPDTCEDFDAHGDETNAATVAIVDQLFGRGIGTSVIGVGDEVGEDHLVALANAGRGLGPDGNAEFYRPQDKRGLASAFERIIAGVSSCVFNLGGEVRDAAAGTILLDGVELALGDDSGWRLATPSRIELLGGACDAVKLGADLLSITFPCGSFASIR